jgi:hypothetical protein
MTITSLLNADLIVGSVYPPTGKNVRIGAGDIEAGTVNSLSDAIPTFLAYYEKYPLQWDCILNEHDSLRSNLAGVRTRDAGIY